MASETVSETVLETATEGSEGEEALPSWVPGSGIAFFMEEDTSRRYTTAERVGAAPDMCKGACAPQEGWRRREENKVEKK